MDYKLVEVVWVDAEEHGDIGWNSLKSMKAYAKKPCPVMRSIGYVLFHGDGHIALASTVGKTDCSSIEKIPSEFIKSIIELSPDDDPIVEPKKRK